MRTELLEILRCPRCGAAFRGAANGAPLECGACGARYPVQDDVPDLSLFDELDEATRLEVEAQDRCAGDIYDNPETLAFWWDLIDTAEMARALPSDARRVLDVGAGIGNLGEATSAFVVGIDLSWELLRRARRRLPQVVRADAARLPFADGAFDAVFVRGTLHHLVTHDRPLAEMARVLRPGGVAVFSDPRTFAPLERVKGLLRRGSKYYAETHRAFTLDEYPALIGRSFTIESVRVRHGPGVMVLNAIDAFFLGRFLPARPALARALHALDRPFGRAGLLRGVGMVIDVVARRA